MRSFLRSTLDHAQAVLERERPFFSLGSLSMYTLSVIAEVPVILARIVLVTIITAIVLIIENKSTVTFDWLYLALIPTGWSMLALITPIGSAWWWQTRAGGRTPSKREQLANTSGSVLTGVEHREGLGMSLKKRCANSFTASCDSCS